MLPQAVKKSAKFRKNLKVSLVWRVSLVFALVKVNVKVLTFSGGKFCGKIQQGCADKSFDFEAKCVVK
jgi:hypothetical protein